MAFLSSRQEHYQALIRESYASDRASVQADTSKGSILKVLAEPFIPSTSPGTKIGRFRNCHQHRTGVSCTVYVTKNPDATEIWALKVACPSSEVKPHNAHREARLLVQLGRQCPYVLNLLKTDKDGGDFILVLPYIPLTLADLLATNQMQSGPSVLRDVAEALRFIHSQGVIHRDVKPSNILLKSSEGPACLCDFGIAWAPMDHDVEEAENGKCIEIGTTHYRPPEVLFGYRGYGTEVDIWAFGCVIAEAENGSPLFEAGDLGSDLTLIASIFRSLGTPDPSSWPVSKS
jgi:cyclin-dependent kinase